jgi:hypothetical protein
MQCDATIRSLRVSVRKTLAATQDEIPSLSKMTLSETKEDLTMLKAVRQSVSKMTSHLQLINSYLAVKDYGRALVKTRKGIKELHTLATSLTGLSNIEMTVP